jgi:hypothetical protein
MRCLRPIETAIFDHRNSIIVAEGIDDGCSNAAARSRARHQKAVAAKVRQKGDKRGTENTLGLCL